VSFNYHYFIFIIINFSIFFRRVSIFAEKNKKRDVRGWYEPTIAREGVADHRHQEVPTDVERGDIPVLNGDCEGRLPGTHLNHPAPSQSVINCQSVVSRGSQRIWAPKAWSPSKTRASYDSEGWAGASLDARFDEIIWLLSVGVYVTRGT